MLEAQLISRTAQITFAVSGIILLAFLIKDPDAIHLFSTLFSNWLLAAFSFGVIAPLFFTALILKSDLEGKLGTKGPLILFVIELMAFGVWLGTGIPLFLQAKGQGCLTSYGGLCVDMMVLVAFTIAEMLLTMVMFATRVKDMAGG